MLSFDKWEFTFKHLNWQYQWYFVSMLMSWIWSIILLVVNIVLIVLKKDTYTRGSGGASSTSSGTAK